MSPYVLMLQTDPDDIHFTESALAEIDHSIPVRFIFRIEEMGAFIEQDGLPAIILINDDVIHKAVDHLKQIKANSTYNHIPVVILGEVANAEYIRSFYRRGANSYITKPSTVEGTRKKINSFLDYWFHVADV